VDNDAALARGWAQGFPKRIGSIFQTRSFAAPSAAAAPLARGSRFAGSLSAHGVRLAEVRVKLQAPEPEVTKIFSRPTVNLRYFPRLAASEQSQPAVDELVMSVTERPSYRRHVDGRGRYSPARGRPARRCTCSRPCAPGPGVPLLDVVLGDRPAHAGARGLIRRVRSFSKSQSSQRIPS